jgi:hypothetical protein
MYPFQFNPFYPDATDEQLLEQIRNWRSIELTECDWTQLADSNADKAAWATYRQALRDLPASNKDPKKIVFPTRPS